MAIKKIGFIGLGLIGGSIAKAVRRIHPDIRIIATSGHLSTVLQAFEAGVIDNKTLLEPAAFADLDYVFLCTPVQQNQLYLKQLKQVISEGTMITDVGSVKDDIYQTVLKLQLEEHFIGGHPMAGSEKTGFAASNSHLLENAYYVLAPTSKTPTEKIEEFRDFVSSFGSIPLILDSKAHDFATAAISHLPHVMAYSLVNLIKSIDDENETMKTIAAGGFRDMTRIAASSPVMWQEICLSNKEQLLHLIDLYSKQLLALREEIASENKEGLLTSFSDAKEYRDTLFIRTKSEIQPIYELYCDLIDEVGGIATLATLLASNGINIKNIGILHNREFQGGVLHIELYDRQSLDFAAELLKKYHYTVYQR